MSKTVSFVVITNRQNSETEKLAQTIIAEMAGEGWKGVLFSEAEKAKNKIDMKSMNFALSLGGDGTVLYSSRCVASAGIPILPVNMGRLGFIAWVKQDEWKERMLEAVSGQLGISRRAMLSTEIIRDGQTVASYIALNDGVVSASRHAKIINLGIRIGDASLGSYRADGIIVSTPTGSTAYSLAAGGPVLDPDMNALVFNPVCPFTLSNRSLVVPGSEKIVAVIEDGQRESIVFTADGQDVFPLQEGDRLVFSVSEMVTRLFSAHNASFYQILKTKLNWSGGPDA